jgi:hypothetical protein
VTDDSTHTSSADAENLLRWLLAEKTWQLSKESGAYEVAFEGRERAWNDLSRIITLLGEDPDDFEITAVPALLKSRMEDSP